MWKIAGTLWKSFLNLVLRDKNKMRATDNHVSGKELLAVLHIQITILIGRFPETVNGCK